MTLIKVLLPLCLALTAAVVAGETTPEKLGPIETEAALRQLREGDWILQTEAMELLSAAKVVAAVPAIEEKLQDNQPTWLRGKALVALAHITGEKALDRALQFAGSPDATLRSAAVDALYAIGSPKGARKAYDLLADPDNEVRRRAIVAFASLVGDKSGKAVLKLLDGADAVTVRAVAGALRYVDTPDSRNKLADLLANPDAETRQQAALSLGRLKDQSAILPLLRAMGTDSDWGVRDACESALLSYDRKNLEEPLTIALTSGDANLYAPSFKLAPSLPGRALADRVSAALREKRLDYGNCAVQAMDYLQQVGGRDYSDIYVSLLGNAAPEVRRRAAEAVGACDNLDHFALLRPRLDDENPGVAVTALKALAASPSATPEGGIYKYLAEPLARRGGDAAFALPALELTQKRQNTAESDQALSVLAPVLRGAAEQPRTAAAACLARLSDAAEFKRKTAAAQGYVVDFSLAGPFPLDKEKGARGDYGVGNAPDLSKTYTLPPAAEGEQKTEIKWKRVGVEDENGWLLLHEILPPPTNAKATFLVAEVTVSQNADATATLETDWDAECVLLLGDKELLYRKHIGNVTRGKITLIKGVNRLMLRTGNERGSWNVRLRLCQPDGAALQFK